MVGVKRETKGELPRRDNKSDPKDGWYRSRERKTGSPVSVTTVAGTKFPLEVGDLVVSSTEGMEEGK